MQLSGKFSSSNESPVPVHSQHRQIAEPQLTQSAQDLKPDGPPAHPDATPAITAEPKAMAPAVAINRPLSLEPEPAPATPRPVAVTAVNLTPSTRAGPRESPAETGRVWVKVPRSWYYQVAISTSHKEPPLEELQKLVARTEEQIKTAIALVVPLSGPSAWKTTIDMIPDELPLHRPPAVSAPSEARRLRSDWAVAGTLGALATALLMFGSWILSSRRPSAQVDAAPRKLSYHEGSSLAPGPSERLREFVRRNPESAVCVLGLWTSQGGGV